MEQDPGALTADMEVGEFQREINMHQFEGNPGDLLLGIAALQLRLQQVEELDFPDLLLKLVQGHFLPGDLHEGVKVDLVDRGQDDAIPAWVPAGLGIFQPLSVAG